MYKKCLVLAFLAFFLLPIHSSNADRGWRPGDAAPYPKGEVLRFISVESWVAIVFRGDTPDRNKACKVSTLWENKWGSNILEMIKMAGPTAFINPQFATPVSLDFGNSNPQPGGNTLAGQVNTLHMCGVAVVTKPAN